MIETGDYAMIEEMSLHARGTRGGAKKKTKGVSLMAPMEKPKSSETDVTLSAPESESSEEAKKRRKREYMKAYMRRRKEEGKKPKKRASTPTSKAKNAERMKKVRAAKKQKPARAPYRRVKELSSNGAHPPHPFKHCPECGHPMPTIEARLGEFVPAAKPFCGDCGFRMPVIGG